jgi:hypothetical protein
MRLCLIDGSSLSYIMHATDISVRFPCGTTHQVMFLITKLDTEFPAVLGLDWLTLHNPLINWAASNDDTSSDFLEDLPDPNPVNIPEPTTEFISNPTVDSIPVTVPVPNTTLVSNSILNNSGTGPIPLISLVSAEAFMRSMQSEGAQCFLILAHEPLKPILRIN